MQYIMMPLDEHYDRGFGSVADAFHGAAIALREAKPKAAFFEHLPQSFLFRHSVELFLKSGIVIVHRKLKLPYDTEPYDSEPTVAVNGKRKPIYAVHGIGALYQEWKSLIEPPTDELREMCKFKPDWTIGPDMDGWIKTIDDTDPNSTYFRYPSMKNPAEDQKKSPFKKIAPEELFPASAPDDRRVMALVIENAAGEVTRVYMNEKSSDEFGSYMTALEEASKLLYCYHAMMRMELTGGF
jgi:hypothetical protein